MSYRPAAFLIASALLFAPFAASAAPMRAVVGAAQATLRFDPDPPHVGRAHAIVTLTGVSRDTLARTKGSFGTLMPSMSMTGPGGALKATAPGRYEFDPMLGMAAAWDVTVTFSGGVTGTATYHIAVQAGTAAATLHASAMTGMSGMSSSGDPGAWRTATYAFVIIAIVGLLMVLRARRKQRPLAIGITVAAAVLTFVLAFIQSRYAAPPMDMAAMSSIEGDAPTPVTFATVHVGGDRSTVYAPGTIEPYFTQDILTRASGILRDFTVYAGDRVHTGQTLATLDAPDVQARAQAASADAAAQEAAARAAEIEAHHHAPNAVIIADTETSVVKHDLTAAEADRTAKAEQLRYWRNEVSRETGLLRDGAVSQQEYQDERAQEAAAQAAYETTSQHVSALQEQIVAVRLKATDAVASVEQMQEQAASAVSQAARAQANARMESALAGYTTITSPSNAIVMKRLIDPGVYVQLGTPIVRIAVIDRLRVEANVAQSYLRTIHEGTPIDATLGDGTVIHGRVTSIAPVADPTTHTASVEAVVKNSRPNLTPGGFARVTFHVRAIRGENGMQVPSSAIVGAGADAAVWTNVNGSAHRVPVKVDSDDGTFATVSGRLTDGARVVVEGAPMLEEGLAIKEQHS